MGMEIERRFFVQDLEKLGTLPLGSTIRQAYVKTLDSNITTRIRIKDDHFALLTIKGPTAGISRAEYEYPIPVDDAEEMMGNLCGDSVYKTRYKIPYGGLIWELDIFDGPNAGLIIVEVELTSEDQEIDFPPWIGEEIKTHMLSNFNLAWYPWNKFASSLD
jgi:adenylate cyclase